MIFTVVASQSCQCSSLAEWVDPVKVLSPFLAILWLPNLAGPFKMMALESIQDFISCSVLSQISSLTTLALSKVVEATTRFEKLFAIFGGLISSLHGRCKFVQTDSSSDESLELRIVQTLNCIIQSPCGKFIGDRATFDIVEFYCKTLVNGGFTCL